MSIVDVSVIIPYYRSYDTIIRAIDSVFNQSYLPTEIIVVDDFSSTEKDNKRLKDLEQLDMVKVIYLDENVGPGEARNVGIEMSKSKYIAFLDSDDAWVNTKLEIQYNIMEKLNCYISGHGSTRILDNSINISPLKKYKIKKIKNKDQLLKNQFLTRSVMIRKDINLRFVKGKRRAEDYLLWTMIVLHGYKAVYIKAELCISFKENYGESGLTQDLNKMYYAILDSYKILYKESYIIYPTLILLSVLQTGKHFYRNFKLFIRRFM